MPYPNDFLYAFAKLERAVEELVGTGEVKERLDAAARASFMIFAEDFPPVAHRSASDHRGMKMRCHQGYFHARLTR